MKQETKDAIVLGTLLIALAASLICGSLSYAASTVTLSHLTPTVISSGVTMGVATATSPAVIIYDTSNLEFQMVWTGSPSGTFVPYVSEDLKNWDPLTISQTLTATPGATHVTLDLVGLPSPYIEIVYMGTSGSGTLGITGFGKR